MAGDERIYPDADVAIGNWEDDDSGTSNIYQTIDEVSADDGDYIRTENNPSSSSCEIGFTAPSDTTPLHGRLSYRYRKQGDGTASLTVKLKKGSQVVQTWTHSAISTSWTQANQLIVAELRGSAWSDIRVVFIGDVSGGTGTTVEVSWAEIRTAVVKTIGTSKDYTTITSWAGGLDNTTYPTANSVAEGQGYDEAFDETWTVSGIESNIIGWVLTAASGEQHDGTEGTGFRVVRSGDGVVCAISRDDDVDYVVDWLEIDINGHVASDIMLDVQSYENYKTITHLLLHGATDSGSNSGLASSLYSAGFVSITNLCAYDIERTTPGATPAYGVSATSTGGTIVLANITIHDVSRTSAIDDVYGLYVTDSANVTIDNTVVTDTGGSTSGTIADYSSTSSVLANTNASSDSTAPDPITGEPVVSAAEYVSNTDPYDLHLLDAECVDEGTDLETTPAGVNLAMPVGSYTRGYDRDADPETVSPWDVGAFEYVAVAISGTTCWGHDTSVEETNTRDFTGNWSGTGSITGSGDSEQIELDDGEYMNCDDVINTGAVTVTLTKNKYGSGDASVVLKYRTGATVAACQAASWNTYSTPFSSLGYVQARVEDPA